MMQMPPKKPGFTLIELMLAMTFVSALLLMIALTSIQAGKMYNSGITLRMVNHSGRSISDTLRRDFTQADQRRVSLANDGSGAVILLRESGQVKSGRFCLGDYSYLWNSPSTLDGAPGGTGGAVFDPSGQPINFIRVVDEGAVLCESSSGSYVTNLASAGIDNAKITHLLKRKSGGNEVVLGIHEMRVLPVAAVANNSDGLFSVDFRIGTSRLSEIDTADQSCRPPTDSESNTEFCAINQFNMIVRTNG